MYSMDKFQNEEKVGFYYESSQDSHLSDSDWNPLSQESQESQVCSQSSQESTSDEGENI